jgi:hypothetical protein
MVQQMVGEDQVGEQLPAGVVGDQDHRGAGSERGPQAGAVVGDEPVRRGLAGPRADAEAQIGTVAPQRRQQLGLPLLAGGQPLHVVEGLQVRLQRGIGELRGLQVPERVNPVPRALAEEADRVEEPPVEVGLRPQERRLEPGPAEVARAPRGPGRAVVRLGGERPHRPGGDLLKQAVEGLPLRRPVRMRVPDLGNQPGGPVVPYPPGEPVWVAVQQFRWQHGVMLRPWWRPARHCRLL